MKINKIIYKWLLLAGLAISGVLPARGQEELVPYLKKGAENNPEIQALFKEYMAALEKAPQVGTLPDPKVAFGYFISPVETRVGAQQGNLSVTQMFPWFGELDAREQVAIQRAKAAYKTFEDVKNRLFFRIRSTYNNLYVLYRAIEITEENLQLLRSFRELARIKFESGKSGFVDVLRVDMDIAALENQLAYLKDSEQPLLAKFEELLNTPVQQPLKFPDTLWSEELNIEKEAIFDSILAENPRLHRLDHQAQSWLEQQEVARKAGMPSFNIGLNYVNVEPRPESSPEMSLPDNGKDAVMLPMVGVRIPIYRGKYRAMKREALLKQEAVQKEKEDVSNHLNTQMEEGYRDFLDGKRRVDLYKRLYELAVISRELLVAEYTAAEEDFEEILRMERRVLKYELELAKARADQNTSIAYIEYLMGK